MCPRYNLTFVCLTQHEALRIILIDQRTAPYIIYFITSKQSFYQHHFHHFIQQEVMISAVATSQSFESGVRKACFSTYHHPTCPTISHTIIPTPGRHHDSRSWPIPLVSHLNLLMYIIACSSLHNYWLSSLLV